MRTHTGAWATTIVVLIIVAALVAFSAIRTGLTLASEHTHGQEEEGESSSGHEHGQSESADEGAEETGDHEHDGNGHSE